MQRNVSRESLIYRNFWLGVILIIFLLLLGSCALVWWINQPRLGEILPDYQTATFLKGANVTYESKGGFHNSELTLICGGGTFITEDYKAYATADSIKQILAFFRQEVSKKGFGQKEYSVTGLFFGKFEGSVDLELTNEIICEHRIVNGQRKYPGYAIMFLDPKVQTEANAIATLLPGVKVNSIVFLVMRGFILYEN